MELWRFEERKFPMNARPPFKFLGKERLIFNHSSIVNNVFILCCVLILIFFIALDAIKHLVIIYCHLMLNVILKIYLPFVLVILSYHQPLIFSVLWFCSETHCFQMFSQTWFANNSMLSVILFVSADFTWSVLHSVLNDFWMYLTKDWSMYDSPTNTDTLTINIIYCKSAVQVIMRNEYVSCALLGFLSWFLCHFLQTLG